MMDELELYETEQIIEEVDLATEGDARDYVAANEDRALYVPVIPGLAGMWFFQAGEHFAIVTNEFGEFSLAEPTGAGNQIDLTAFAIDLSDGPLTDEGIEEVEQDLAEYHSE